MASNHSEALTLTSSASHPRRRRWLKRVGVAGFLFFFFKGLLWLVIPGWLLLERGCVTP